MSTNQERISRCLSILRRLQRGSTDRDTLMDCVQIDLGADVYGSSDTLKGQQRIFEGDIKFLRETLQVALPGYDRAQSIYELEGFGDFSPLCLTDSELDTLAFLTEAFQPGAPNSDSVQRFLLRVQDLLTQNQREALIDRRHQLQMRLQQRDADEIDPRVEEALDRALRSHRLLRFAYRSPGQEDGVPRFHTVEPYRRFFDTARGHFYLDAYRRRVEGPYGTWDKGQWQKYRIGRILSQEIQVLPDKFAPIPPKRPQFRLEYRLAPAVARLGVTRHFNDMQVVETDAEGWVQIRATTDDLFGACRLLLGYGPNCHVTGGSDARREMEALVQGMARLYSHSS
jgi:predicted DNA-binding transcriptional regulator YafY